MRKLILLFLLASLISCNKKENTKPDSAQVTKTQDSSAIDNSKTAEKEIPDSLKKLFGYYTGDFVAVKYNENSDYTYANKITVSLDSIVGNNLFGHSIVAGNLRPFKGEVTFKNGVISANGSEPGDDKYDGEFIFKVNPTETKITGIWNSYRKDNLVTQREYKLMKRNFAYNKNLEIPNNKNWNTLYEKNPKFPDKIEQISGEISNINASNTLLKKSDIDNLYKGDLEVIRNSIYARHGYSFKTRKMRYFFDTGIDWYMPVSTDVRNELTDIELKNIELLKRFEEHAENYYDEYGR